MLNTDIQAEENVVVSGSLVGWGADIENAFDLIVFLYLPASIRLERLRQRELARYGTVDPAFLAWASQYDEGVAEGRSLAKHNAWLAQRSCRILRLEKDFTIAERIVHIMGVISPAAQQQTTLSGKI